jgi:hypothetical protein
MASGAAPQRIAPLPSMPGFHTVADGRSLLCTPFGPGSAAAHALAGDNSGCGLLLAAGTDDGHGPVVPLYFDAIGGVRPAARLDAVGLPAMTATVAAASTSGRWVAVGDADTKTVNLYEITGGSSLSFSAALYRPTLPPRAAAFSADDAFV